MQVILKNWIEFRELTHKYQNKQRDILLNFSYLKQWVNESTTNSNIRAVKTLELLCFRMNLQTIMDIEYKNIMKLKIILG